MPEANQGQAPAGDPQKQGEPQTQPTSNETFETWLAAQPEEVKSKVKTLYEAQTTGLKSALVSERQARSDAEKQLRELAKKAEKGSELESALTKQADQLNALEKQSSFYDKAHAAGVRNLKLAYLAAAQAGLVGDKGECDFARLRTEYPELFMAAPPPGNAGNGTNAQQPGKVDMNQAIRQALGR